MPVELLLLAAVLYIPAIVIQIIMMSPWLTNKTILLMEYIKQNSYLWIVMSMLFVMVYAKQAAKFKWLLPLILMAAYFLYFIVSHS